MTSAPVAPKSQRTRRLSRLHKRLLEEIRRMEAVPGIHFMDGFSGRVPVIARTGVEVWEVVSVFKVLNGDLVELYASLDWLSCQQVDAALAYYRAYPAEVDQQIAENEWGDPDAGNVTYPLQL